MEIESRADATIVRLDASYSAFHELLIQQAEEAIVRSMDEAPSANLVLDFQDTVYFGSAFFEVLFRLWKRTESVGGRFLLCRLSADCYEILDMARLTTLWEIAAELPSRVTHSGGLGIALS
jgi:anti-anti-sigma factor